MSMIQPYLPEMDIDGLVQSLDGWNFPITRDMRRLLDSFDGLGRTGGLGLMRLECRAHELMALCLEQALGFDGYAGLHPDDLSAVQSVRDKIETDPVSVPDIATLAREYAVSTSKLSRDFKRAYMAVFFTREFNWTRNTFKHIELHLMNIEDMSRRRK